ncbi:glycosyltransferase family 39 protein [Nitrosopumilus adriaticus]|uniref:glycosyltransferase family 39 protein n=1 Tax=Nitrosopumilus adriaticus TaxID=1580092 RepID=UPI000A4A5968|nr:glycosyltransferase family 39 protein [Nitrosopumilus adriaticus]
MMNSDLIVNDKKIIFSFLSIFFMGLGIRIFYFPFELPLIIDAMDNFTYATAINYYGYLPTEGSPANNGWPIFLSFWFSILSFENTHDFMQIQRMISVILSSLIIIPVYFLCKKFFDDKIALVGAAIFAFDPRIILNSLLGITEPLFILLGILSLVVFLKYDRKLMFIAFALSAFATIVRSEGIFLFFGISILFFLKYRISKDIVKTYLPCVIIFLIILFPIMNYKIEVTGYDGIFQRVAYGTGEILTISNQDNSNSIFEGIELFVKYLGWVMIPIFLFLFLMGL